MVPVSLLMKDKFDTLSKLPKLMRPVLVLHGELDEVIPVQHSRTLLEHLNVPYRSRFYPEGHHSDFPLEAVAREVRKFVDDVPKLKAAKPGLHGKRAAS